MDAYDLMMDRYRAEQRFRKEIQEELAALKKCQNECKADAARKGCIACGRTMEEITKADLNYAKEQPIWVCSSCGKKHGNRACEIATWHIGTCGVCKGENRAVTEPRDFGYLKRGWSK